MNFSKKKQKNLPELLLIYVKKLWRFSKSPRDDGVLLYSDLTRSKPDLTIILALVLLK